MADFRFREENDRAIFKFVRERSNAFCRAAGKSSNGEVVGFIGKAPPRGMPHCEHMDDVAPYCEKDAVFSVPLAIK